MVLFVLVLIILVLFVLFLRKITLIKRLIALNLQYLHQRLIHR